MWVRVTWIDTNRTEVMSVLKYASLPVEELARTHARLITWRVPEVEHGR